jgi:hypothetical protein
MERYVNRVLVADQDNAAASMIRATLSMIMVSSRALPAWRGF